MKPLGEKTVDGSEAMLKGLDLTKLFPEGSDAKLVRQGMINCAAGRCELVLEP